MGDAQQDMPEPDFQQPPLHETSLLGSLLDYALVNPGMAAAIFLGLAWLVITKVRAMSAGVTIGDDGGKGLAGRESAMEAARERQQQQMAAAAEARRKAVAPSANSKPASPTVPAAAEMPARMKAAMERRQATERAETRLQPPAPPAPEAPPPSSKKESLLEKMERIEKGKGSSDFNPLHGKTQTGGQGLTQRKKGG
jgi:hypothetical protein